jgi:hypothetical protein
MRDMKKMKNIESSKEVNDMKRSGKSMKKESFLNVKNLLLVFMVGFYWNIGFADSAPSVPATSTVDGKSPNPQQNAASSLTLSPKQQTKLAQLFKNDKVDSTTKAAITNVLPLSPAQIEAFKQQNAAVAVAQEPDPISNTQLQGTIRSINLLSDSTPPMLHLVMNYATNISFIGENGQPWPIADIVPGSDAITASPSYKSDPYNSSIIVTKPWVSTNVTYISKDA